MRSCGAEQMVELERNAARSSAWQALRESGVEDGEVGGLAV